MVVLVAFAVATILVISAWNDTGAATGEIPMRIFLVGWAVAAVVIAAGSPLAGLTSRRGRPVPGSVLPLDAQHVAVGLVIGLAVGTTDWTALRLAGWWQLWWTVPLLLAYTVLLGTLRRSPRT